MCEVFISSINKRKSVMPRLDNLQILRIIAFLAVFVSHTGLGSVGALGALGVSIFIIMSGFLMTYNYFYVDITDKTGLRFAWNKIKRLYPLHIVMMLAMVLLSMYGMLRNNNFLQLGVMVKNILLNIFLVQAWVPKADYYFALNAVSWYLSMCFFLYFVYPRILSCIKKYRKRSDAVKAISIAVLWQIIISVIAMLIGNRIASDWFSQHWLTYIFPLYRLGDLIIGSNLGYIFLRKKNKEKKKNRKNYIVEILTILLCVSLCYIFTTGRTILGGEGIKYTLLFFPASVLLIWIYASNRSVIGNLLNCRFMMKISTLTSSAFLIHRVVISYSEAILYKLMGSYYNNWISAMFSFVITLVCSGVYQWYVAPFLEKKGTLLQSHSEYLY